MRINRRPQLTIGQILCGCQFISIAIFYIIIASAFSKLYQLSSTLSTESIQTQLLLIAKDPQFNDIAHKGFQAILGHTDRLWMIDPSDSNSYLSSKQVVMDLTSNKEFSFILNSMKRSKSFQKGIESGEIAKFVVEIGAFNGITISNSFNFFQLGWDGLLVEPTPSSFNDLERNIKQFGSNQKITAVNCAVAETDGEVRLLKTQTGTQNRIHNRGDIIVRAYSMESLFNNNNVPKKKICSDEY